MKADKRTEREVMEVLGRITDAYARRDLDGLLSCFAPDPDVIMYGTGADEKRIGLQEIEEQARRDWSQSDSMALETQWYSVSAAGPVAWLSADTTFKGTAGGQSFAVPARLTVVMERRDNQWLCTQAHFSMAAPGQEEGESFPE